MYMTPAMLCDSYQKQACVRTVLTVSLLATVPLVQRIGSLNHALQQANQEHLAALNELKALKQRKSSKIGLQLC